MGRSPGPGPAELPEPDRNSPDSLSIEAEILGGDRAAFRAWVGLPQGRRMVEHVMLEIEAGRIIRQVEVEVWD